jgi:hypothetical protein
MFTRCFTRCYVIVDLKNEIIVIKYRHSCYGHDHGRGRGSIEICVRGSAWKGIHGLMTPERILSILLDCWNEEKMSVNSIDYRTDKNSLYKF